MNCPKCGLEVRFDNDGSVFEAILRHGDPLLAITIKPYHLLPVVDKGIVRCTGSPSRAQYVAGQPRDQRPEYAYDPAKQPFYAAAYDGMLAFARVNLMKP